MKFEATLRCANCAVQQLGHGKTIIAAKNDAVDRHMENCEHAVGSITVINIRNNLVRVVLSVNVRNMPAKMQR